MSRKEMKENAKLVLGNSLFNEAWLMPLLVLVVQGIVTGISSSAIGIGILIVMGPLAYGISYAFLNQTRTKKVMEITDVFKGFQDDFLQNFLIGLLTSIYTFLWSLLFIIPGIVKSYAYSMASFIKVDHPDYDAKKCIEESKRITNGHKMDLFILDLSFIGWYIVGALCLGLGTLWVAPYVEATKTQFYESIKSA